jgi:SAM-dependent methyltransferase
MKTLSERLRRRPAGHVLDLATGQGDFLREILPLCDSFTQAIGVDLRRDALAMAREAFADDPRVLFQVADVRALPFAAARFDTLLVANSLHHFADPEACLAGAVPLLRSGGMLIVKEMVSDGQTPAQQTHIRAHELLAAIHTLRGHVHRRTHTRVELRQIFGRLGLGDLHEGEVPAPPSAPGSGDVPSAPEEDHVARWAARLEKELEELRDRPEECAEMRRRLASVREWAAEHGIALATQWLTWGVRP